MLLNTNAFLLDIETSGLSRENHQIICIGVQYVASTGELKYKQWVLEKGIEEKELLNYFIQFCQNFQRVYTYNGKGFDWPFLLARLQFHQLKLDALQHLVLVDMKKILNPIASKRFELEKAISYTRQTSVSGKELVRLYTTYASCGEAPYLALILKHNIDELNSLLALYEVYHLLYHLEKLPCIYTEQTEHTMTYSLQTPTSLSTELNFTYEAFTLTWNHNSHEIHFQVQLNNCSLKQYLEPVKDYYYIPDQGQLLHKSLASFISNSQKRKATKEECVIIKTSSFIKLHSTYRVMLPLWYDHSKEVYIEFTENQQLLPLLLKQLFYLFFHEKTDSLYQL